MELKIEYVKTSDLKPYEKNAKAHGKEDLKAIVQSIQDFGFNDPIGTWNGVIVEGHGRWLAAQQLGIEQVPTIRLDELTDEQRKAYALAHNKTTELSGWDFDILATELKSISEFDMSKFGFDLTAVGEEEGEIQEDNFIARPEKRTTTRLGDIFRLGGHCLICGDSTKEETIEKLLQGQQADLLLTDPPYNVALGHHMRPSEAKQLRRRTDGLVIDNDAFDSETEFTDFLIKAFKSADKGLKPGGAFYIWHAHNWSRAFFSAAEAAGWQVRECLVWNKNTFALGRQDYQWKHEPCLYGWKDGAAHYFISDRTKSTVFEGIGKPIEDMKKDELKEILQKFMEEFPSTVIEEKKPSRSEDHPTMKPIALLARQIKNSSRKGEIVLDIFGGSGSTMIACEQLGRRCYMAELDPAYCDVIVKRWEEFTGQKAEKINDQETMEVKD